MKNIFTMPSEKRKRLDPKSLQILDTDSNMNSTQRKGTMDNQKIATELVDMAERIAHEVVKVSAPKGKTQIALLNYMRDNIGTGLEIGLTDIPYRDVPDHLNNIMNAALALSKQGLLALDYGDGDELTIKLTRKGAI
tara:strand:+ start:965 stop:1375 length:411 start_codon:yes stop_codon:yes gene_type:complete